jgi:hypothetical protein
MRRARRAARQARLMFLVDHNVRAEVGNLLEGSGFHIRRTYQKAQGSWMIGRSLPMLRRKA